VTAKGIERKKPKPEILKDGATSKADVLRELGDFDTNASEAQPRLHRQGFRRRHVEASRDRLLPSKL